MHHTKYWQPRESAYDRSWNKVFNDLFNTGFHGLHGQDMIQTSPAVNVIEKEDAYHIEVAAPGLNKADFNVQVEKNVLTISAKKAESTEEVKPNFRRREFSYETFERNFRLTDKVNGTNITARYENGILMVRVPKREVAEPQTTSIAID